MTEEEAKGKWCPHSRTLHQGGIDETPTSNGTLRFTCIGSECMAWRWTNGDVENMRAYHSEWNHDDRMKAHNGISIDDGDDWHYEYTHGDNEGKYDMWYRTTFEPKHVNGYCGLAGKP